ncbi:MAG TPA: Gfo/Idh/MocA family oxidoreductase [Oligoflexia bacterium]|nr:Gfo/Idh/MocA family oxidoreductase [Oligoflexia bacterium]
MSVQPLRLGIVGTRGNGAKLLADAVPLVPDLLTIAATCDVAQDAKFEGRCAQWQCRGFRDIDTMLAQAGSDIDILHVATPSGMHLEPILAGLKAGKHVLSDKPLDVTVARMRLALGAAQESAGRLFVVSQNRWLPGMQLAAAALKKQRLSKLCRITVISPWNRGDDYYHGSWRGKWATDGGAAMINQTIHPVDLATNFAALALGVERNWDMIELLGGVILQVAHQPEVLEADDVSHMHFKLSGGAEVDVVAMTAAKPERKWTIAVEGWDDDGFIVDADGRLLRWEFNQPGDEDAEARKLGPIASASTGGASDPLGVGSAAHAEMLRALIPAIWNDRPFELEGAQGAFAGLLIRQFYENARDPMGLRPDNFKA